MSFLSGDETIAAIITPPGEGGIAAIRLAGSHSRFILNSHFFSKSNKEITFPPFLMRYGYFQDKQKNIIDEVTAVFMPEGNSFTGLDQVEIFCHGGQTVVNNILNELLDSDCRAAEPGEFT
ncbi:MAG: tRNA uridine-5-carboxymethylaminomethyl(34) synthesis GTPase MnmE, partial [candidate division Zixibacteria bacterium]|nr:tRNA uridine-5-carboxymethylaminomethyl(34) synthesis GTPase MnmE [candidate division Zixibacteria bacterium]